jgi:hypothetical protein
MSFVALSLASTLVSYSRPRDDWRSAAAFVFSHCEPGDAVAFEPEYGHIAFEYFERRLPQTGPRPFNVNLEDPGQFAPISRLWMVSHPMSPQEAAVLPAQAQILAKYRILQQARFRGVNIILFGPRTP